jgi:O-antigen ligase
LALLERIALAALAAAAAFVVPGGLNRFVFGKLAIAGVGTLAAISAPARGLLPRLAVSLLACAGLLLGIAAATGHDPRAQLIGLPPRYEGLIALPIYLGALVAGARMLGPGRASGSTAWFLRWLSLAALAVGAVAILEAAHIEPLPGTGSRTGSLLGNASDEGAWAVLCLGPLTAIAIAGRRVLHVAAAGFAVAALICAESRGALLGVLGVAAMLAVSLPKRRQRLTVALAMAIVVAIVLGLPASRDRVTGADRLASKTAHGRVLLTEETVKLIADDPVIGYGPSGFVDELPHVHSVEYERVIGPQNPPDSPHDWLLQAAVAGGIALGLLAISLAWLTLTRGWAGLTRHPTPGEAAAYSGLLAGLFGYSITLLFHFTSPGTTPLAAVFAGALLGRAATSRDPSRLRRALARLARTGTLAALIALLVVLVAGAIAEIPLRAGVVDAARGRLRAASHQFEVAEDWRPWDVGVAALATHVFATLADRGVAGAASVGAPWAKKALAADRRSVEVLADAADIAAAAHEDPRALTLISLALTLDPRNPRLLARRGELLP